MYLELFLLHITVDFILSIAICFYFLSDSEESKASNCSTENLNMCSLRNERETTKQVKKETKQNKQNYCNLWKGKNFLVSLPHPVAYIITCYELARPYCRLNNIQSLVAFHRCEAISIPAVQVFLQC